MIPRKTVRHEQVSRIRGLFQMDIKYFRSFICHRKSGLWVYTLIVQATRQRYYLIAIDIDSWHHILGLGHKKEKDKPLKIENKNVVYAEDKGEEGNLIAG